MYCPLRDYSCHFSIYSIPLPQSSILRSFRSHGQSQGWILNGLSQSVLSHFLCHHDWLRDRGMSWDDPIRVSSEMLFSGSGERLIFFFFPGYEQTSVWSKSYRQPDHHTERFSTLLGACVFYVVSPGTEQFRSPASGPLTTMKGVDLRAQPVQKSRVQIITKKWSWNPHQSVPESYLT